MLNLLNLLGAVGSLNFTRHGGLKFCVRTASLVKFRYLSARAFLKFHSLGVRFFKFHHFAACALRRTGIFCVARFQFVKNSRKIGSCPALGS